MLYAFFRGQCAVVNQGRKNVQGAGKIRQSTLAARGLITKWVKFNDLRQTKQLPD